MIGPIFAKLIRKLSASGESSIIQGFLTSASHDAMEG
jgi:hypothetical protein